MRVFVTGGTGLIGTRLVRRLGEHQDSVVVLTRRPTEARERLGPACTVVEGDPMKPGPWMDAIDDCDAVIHLAGENVFARRWNEAFKNLIRDSRVRGTDNVVQALSKNPRTTAGNPRVLVNASAVGYYGPHGDEELTEDSPPGDDFLARACVDWEKAALAGERLGLRVAVVRVGVVLDPQGGALAKLLTPFKLGAGGKVGTGRQWMPWVHRDDIVGLFLLALDSANATGPINGTAPNPVTNYEFTKALGRALGRPTLLPTPAFALRLMLGEVAGVVTSGQRVLPRRAQALGYQFKFPTIDGALADLLK
jgi:uncharacterized protein (TIGR01777 family)